ncbi:MAG: dihydropteroate synthase [Bacteroidaceae bacterium]|nr:dihydropteroate synthase [Bacteroidaceae bacterium]
MKASVPYTLNVRGRLFNLSTPQVMGILNVTPDSFYAASRVETEESIRVRVRQIVAEGGSMIDVGAYSSRPGADDVSAEEEMERLRRGVRIVREEAPEVPVSIDTFRADVAKMAIEELGADIINDISGGELDKRMFATVAKLGVPYILMHMKGTPQTMQQAPHYDDLMKEVLLYFAEKIQQLRDLGQKDIIIDPGYGFAKTLDHNYELLQHQDMLQVFELPILVGVSRKSMIYRLLGCAPDEALNGTTVVNTIALQKGASILRVHDVKEAVEVVTLYQKTVNSKSSNSK